MTSTAFTRAALLEEGGYRCEAVVFSPLEERRTDIERLTSAGVLPAAGRLANLWDLLSELPDPAPKSVPKWDHRLKDDAHTEEFEVDGVVRVRTHFATGERRILQREHFRPDGTLLVVDRQDTRTRGVPGGRRVTLFDRRERPVRAWRSIWPLYDHVLDEYLGGDPAVIFYDSKVTAPYGQRYRRPNVASVHVIHNLHLAPGEVPPLGVLNPARAPMMRELFTFDRVVCSTDRQRSDIAELLGADPEIRVIPPAIGPAPAAEGGSEGASGRDQSLGAVLASLDERKRVVQVVEAVARARTLAPEADIRLEIFGSGSSERAIAKRIEALGLEGSVHLRGHQPGAKGVFRRAGWTALTSTHEGFGMAIAEAMSAGCVPFAYDVPYGPAELLAAFPEHLVADGDIEALARSIADFASADPEQAQQQSSAAVRAAEEFQPAAVGAEWRRLVNGLEPEIGAGAGAPAKEPRVEAFRVARTDSAVDLQIDIGWPHAKELPDVSLGVANGNLEWRRDAAIRRLAGNRVRARVRLKRGEFPEALAGDRDVIAVFGRGTGARRVVVSERTALGGVGTSTVGVRGTARIARAIRRRLAA
ncbi:glycosyltransferase [Leucobacter luti]|uniref:glycosyltransferase n=1 Tax=Leucobacter luti TaxID=340320 RepID=UPI003D001215